MGTTERMRLETRLKYYEAIDKFQQARDEIRYLMRDSDIKKTYKTILVLSDIDSDAILAITKLRLLAAEKSKEAYKMVQVKWDLEEDEAEQTPEPPEEVTEPYVKPDLDTELF